MRGPARHGRRGLLALALCTVPLLAIPAAASAAVAVSTTNLAFGNYDPVLQSVSTSNVSATATPATLYQLMLSQGLGSATFLPRKMTRVGGTEKLDYNLYLDAARTQPWGDGTGGTGVVQNTGSGTVQNYPVFGAIPSGQLLPAGNYTDTITVTSLNGGTSSTTFQVTATVPPPPSVTIDAGPDVQVPGTIGAAATVTNPPLGADFILFRVYADGACSQLVDQEAVTLTGAGTYSTQPVAVPGPGTYHWRASVLDGSGNTLLSTNCGDPDSTTTVLKAATTVTGDASPGVQEGGSITDEATLAGAYTATGTITFELFAPGDTGCATPVLTTSAPVTANGTVTSPPLTPASGPGTYRWVATFSGNANDAGSSTACNDSDQHVTITAKPAAPGINPDPETTITKKPTGKRGRRSVVRFTSDIPGSTFTCALDDGDGEPCTSPEDYKNLDPGKHRLWVAATSPAGKTDQSPAFAKFRVRG